MNSTSKIIIIVVLLALIGGGIYHIQAPKIAKNYFQESVKAYQNGNKLNSWDEYQQALKLADLSFKLQAPDTTQNLFYAQLLAALNRKDEAAVLLEKIKNEDSTAVAAVEQLKKEIFK